MLISKSSRLLTFKYANSVIMPYLLMGHTYLKYVTEQNRNPAYEQQQQAQQAQQAAAAGSQQQQRAAANTSPPGLTFKYANSVIMPYLLMGHASLRYVTEQNRNPAYEQQQQAQQLLAASSNSQQQPTPVLQA